jgi:undecaprenyl-diphosphatase
VLLIVQAIVLGLLQGLTEFLPVSSSGHLQGVPYLLGWESGSLSFDVMVHAGTLVAVLAYFRDDLLWLATRGLGLRTDDQTEVRRARYVILLLAIGTVPAALAGLLLEDVFAAAFDSPRAVAGFLYVTALLLVGAEMLRRRRAAVDLGTSVRELQGDQKHVDLGRREDSLDLKQVAVIGVAQAVAIFPGISRSGATIAAGMALGLSRAAAARFSFLLSIPIIIGATVAQLPDLGRTEPGTLPFGPLEITLGVAAATISGYWAIRFLLRLVRTDDLFGFARYVAAFATLLLAGTFVIG